MSAGSAGDTVWDVVIVGGGSAGCVLANRLSADPARKVLLLEAGRDLPPGTEPSAILDTYPGRAAFDGKNHWPRIDAYFQPVGHNAAERPKLRHYEQAMIMGGGSSINGQVANRGTPDDYDEWQAMGAAGWGWSSVLPTYIRLERDLDFGGPLHGKDGPIPIHRIPKEHWPKLSHAAAAALARLNFSDIADQNGRYEDGYFAMTLSNNGRHRVSSAMAYLDAQTRRRPNLRIMAETYVRGLAREDRRVTGVVIKGPNGPETIAAREVILSAGAIHSPVLLMRAGIGPAAGLRDLGFEDIVDLPGVGRNLQEHPGISVSAFIRPPGRIHGTTRRHIHVGLRYSSAAPDCPQSDMYMMFAAKSAWHPLGRRIGSIVAWINKPFSRGQVSLQSPDPDTAPLVAFNHLADPRDAARLIESVRFMARLLAMDELVKLTQHASPSHYSGFARALGAVSVRNFLLTAPAAILLDTIPQLRGPFFRTLVAGGTTLADLIADDEALENYVRERVFGQWHPCGTCRMGGSRDRDAVVDPGSGRVHGIEGLRVIDASIMPAIPRANLNLPTIMLAEHLAGAFV